MDETKLAELLAMRELTAKAKVCFEQISERLKGADLETDEWNAKIAALVWLKTFDMMNVK